MASHYYQQAIPPVKDRLRYAGRNLDEIDLCEMENRLLQDEISIHILNLPDHQQSPPPHEIPRTTSAAFYPTRPIAQRRPLQSFFTPNRSASPPPTPFMNSSLSDPNLRANHSGYFPPSYIPAGPLPPIIPENIPSDNTNFCLLFSPRSSVSYLRQTGNQAAKT